jgi:hypothetical protein
MTHDHDGGKTMRKRGPGQLIAGAGGVLLIISLFLPWADVHGATLNGWELWNLADVFLMIAAITALAAAITGGRITLFRPDLSLNAATDLLGVISTVLLTWSLAFDFPLGAGVEIGAYLGLLGAITIAGGAGDYSVLRRTAAPART